MHHENRIERRRLAKPGGNYIYLDAGPRFAITGLFILACIFALDWASYFLVPVSTALIVGLTLGPVVDRMDRLGMPRYLAGAMILGVLIALGYLLFLAFAIPLEEWSVRVPEITARLRAAIFWIKDPLDQLHELSKQVQDATNGDEGDLSVSVKKEGIVNSALSTAPALAGQLLIFTGSFYFFVVCRESVKRAIFMLPGRFPTRLKLARMFRDAEYSFSRYLLAISFINTSFGIVTGLAMWALGMPSAALWGALAAVLNFVMFIGPALMAAILAGVALVTYDTLAAAAVPPLVFIGLNILEGQFITPAIVGARLVLNPLMVFLSLAFWLWLWGAIGAFLAVPILILSTVVLYHVLPPERRMFLQFGPREGLERKDDAEPLRKGVRDSLKDLW